MRGALPRSPPRRGLGRRPGGAPRGRRDGDAGASGEARGRGPPPGRHRDLARPTRRRTRSWLCSVNVGTVAKRAALRGAAFWGLAGARDARASGTSSSAGRCREPPGTLAVPGIEGPIEISRDRWGVPHVRAGPISTSGSARASATGRIASGRSTSTGGSARGGCRRSPARAGLVTDRFMRTLGIAPRRRARGRRARRRTSAPRSTPTAPASTRPPPIARSRSSSSCFA